MAYNTEPTAASVSKRLTGLMSQNNPMMRQARTQGAQQANRRGLLNSSMGVQAGQTAAIGAAMPIASQEAQQANARIQQARGFEHERGQLASQMQHDVQQLASQMQHDAQKQQRTIEANKRLKRMEIASEERNTAANLASAFDKTYSQQLATVMNNENIPASVRQQYFTHAAEVRNSNLSLMEQLYGIDLDWTTPFEPDYPSGGGNATGGTTTATNKSSGGGGTGTAQHQVMQRQAKQIEEQQRKEARRVPRLPQAGIHPMAFNY